MENTLEVGKIYKTKTGKEVYIFEEISKEYFMGFLQRVVLKF